MLNGKRFTFDLPIGEQIAAKMQDANPLGGVAPKHGIEDGRWAQLSKQVQSEEPVARATRFAAEELLGPSDHLA